MNNYISHRVQVIFEDMNIGLANTIRLRLAMRTVKYNVQVKNGINLSEKHYLRRFPVAYPESDRIIYIYN